MGALPLALHSLLSAKRALLGETRRGLGNPDWEAASARILIVRLSPFRDVDRSSSHLILFGETRAALPGAFIDFSFLPDRLDRELLEAAREGTEPLPWFFGAASGRSPADFDLLMVSNAFGLELLNLPYLLSTAGLPRRASARRAAEGRDGSVGAFPLLILGGSNAAQAGALVDEAGDSLVDGLFFGEGEGAIGPLAAILSDRSLTPSRRLAEAASSVPGFWPSLNPELPVKSRRLPASPPPLLSWPLFNGEEAGTARLQITAGCPGLCSFCFEGWDRRPYRELPLPELLAAARELRRATGAESLEVYSFNFNTHEEVVSLLFELGRIFRRVNFMSQRLDILARTEGLLAAELAADKRSFTLGIEGVSRRMRAFYRKGLAEEELERLLGLLVAPGVRELKLFYILSGLETEADLEEFSLFARKLGEARRERAPGLRLLASAGYLVRLPGTPLRHAPLALEEAELGRIARAAEVACAAGCIEFRLAAHFDEYCADQLLALAGGALLPWLEAAPEGGHWYEGSLSRGAWPSLRAFALSGGLLNPGLLGEKGPDWAFPLPFLRAGEGSREEGTLYREYLEARAGRDREPCLGASCAGCGACAEAEDIARMTGHRARAPARADIERITRLMAAKAAFPALPVLASLPDSLSGASEEAAAAWLLRLISAAAPGAEARVFEARPLLPRRDGPFGLPPGAVGRALFLLRGPRPEAAAAEARRAGLEVLPALPELRRARVELLFPGGFAEAAAILASAGHRPAGGPSRLEPAALLKAWLAEERIAFIEEAAGEARRLRVAERDLRKGQLLSAMAEPGRLELELGPKADLGRLLAPLGERLGSLVLLRILELG